MFFVSVVLRIQDQYSEAAVVFEEDIWHRRSSSPAIEPSILVSQTLPPTVNLYTSFNYGQS